MKILVKSSANFIFHEVTFCIRKMERIWSAWNSSDTGSDDIVIKNPDVVESQCGFEYLYVVSATCTVWAIKRSLNPELCSIAGMLHDIEN